jgi:hypothetical protein
MMAITRFAGIVGHQLIHSAVSLSQSSFSQPAADSLSSCPTNVSSLLATDLPDDVLPIRSLANANDLVHLMVKLPLKQDRSGRKQSLARMCKICKDEGTRHDVTYYCYTCRLSANYCSPDEKQRYRDCFQKHVKAIKRG